MKIKSLKKYKDREIDILRVLKEGGIMPENIKVTELYSLIRKMDSNIDTINQNLTDYLNYDPTNKKRWTDYISLLRARRRKGYTTPGWYFWDELGQYCHGPYPLEDEAQEHLELYAAEL